MEGGKDTVCIEARFSSPNLTTSFSVLLNARSLTAGKYLCKEPESGIIVQLSFYSQKRMTILSVFSTFQLDRLPQLHQ